MLSTWITLWAITAVLLGGPGANQNSAGAAQPEVITFSSGDLDVLLQINPVEIRRDVTVRDGDRWITNFTGVSRTLHYRITSRNGPLPKDLMVKEVLEIGFQSHFADYPILEEPTRTVRVGADGSFSDLFALGTNDGSVFPPDFRQVVRQRLYLQANENYSQGRLLAVLAIERRTADIRVKLISPAGNPSQRRPTLNQLSQISGDSSFCGQ